MIHGSANSHFAYRIEFAQDLDIVYTADPFFKPFLGNGARLWIEATAKPIAEWYTYTEWAERCGYKVRGKTGIYP
jgi:hypothetical protein